MNRCMLAIHLPIQPNNRIICFNIHATGPTLSFIYNIHRYFMIVVYSSFRHMLNTYLSIPPRSLLLYLHKWIYTTKRRKQRGKNIQCKHFHYNTFDVKQKICEILFLANGMQVFIRDNHLSSAELQCCCWYWCMSVSSNKIMERSV